VTKWLKCCVEGVTNGFYEALTIKVGRCFRRDRIRVPVPELPIDIQPLAQTVQETAVVEEAVVEDTAVVDETAVEETAVRDAVGGRVLVSLHAREEGDPSFGSPRTPQLLQPPLARKISEQGAAAAAVSENVAELAQGGGGFERRRRGIEVDGKLSTARYSCVQLATAWQASQQLVEGGDGRADGC
jgi:hypothetical protein